MKNKVTRVFLRKCPVSDKERFAHSKCIVPISVGAKVHEDEKFFATIRLINSLFKHCVLLVDDSIQKYNLKIIEPTVELEKLHNKALALGDDWLKRNKSKYETLTIPYNIMRWNDWLSHRNFEESYKRVEALYNSDNEYKEAIHANIKDYLDRYIKRLYNCDFDLDVKHGFHWCLQYLKEECAVMCLWAQEGFGFEVYPADRNQSMAATYEKIIKPTYPEFLKTVNLRFKKM